MRKDKITALARRTWVSFSAIYNNSLPITDGTDVIRLFCNDKLIKLHEGGLPYNVAGRTNGKSITVDFSKDAAFNFFIFFHEYAHYELHFDKSGRLLTHFAKELEADSFAVVFCDFIFPGNYEKLLELVKRNPALSLN